MATEAALDALHRYTHGGHEGCCSAHALAECYATLTALPLPTRIMPEEARADQILTYNVSHFERFQLPGMTVAVP